MTKESLFIESPLGVLKLTATETGLCEVLFTNGKESFSTTANPILNSAREQLKDYFSGKRNNFELPLAPEGTDYQKQIWNELSNIPFGTTMSYGELAKKTNSVARAVGSANGSNPIAIIVPCHRVIGANGNMTGYGGGLDRKIWLLKHESGMLV